MQIYSHTRVKQVIGLAVALGVSSFSALAMHPGPIAASWGGFPTAGISNTDDRGSGRVAPTPQDAAQTPSAALLAFRGSGRVEPEPKGESSTASANAVWSALNHEIWVWRGSGRIANHAA